VRLLNIATLEPEFFATESKCEYAILSHTWDCEEVLFEDDRHGEKKLSNCGKNGLYKVLKRANLAKQDGSSTSGSTLAAFAKSRCSLALWLLSPSFR
ncbi:hypothetical protein B0H67DRAFT_659743, partial [Lasiosphaeris hirsuta]